MTKSESMLVKLESTEISEIERVFTEAKDFREVGERITAPIDSIISETAKVIDADPIMTVSDELSAMNNEVSTVYNGIIDNDGPIMKVFKSLPLVGGLAESLDAKMDEAKFNMKGIEGKIEIIFSGFDISYNSVNTSIDLQMKFLEGLEGNLGKIVAYKDFVAEKSEEFKERLTIAQNESEKIKYEMFIRNVDFFLSNLVVLIGNLDMAKKRLLMRLDSANKLSLAMSSSRPIFKTLLSTAIIETSSQKAIDASMQAMDVMGKTIDKLSSDLTDKAIESSKKAEEMTSKPVVSTTVFIENVTKLKNHFDEIEDYRLQVAKEAAEERKLFSEAKTQLSELKTLEANDTEDFKKQISN
ncbi:MAG: hypothetical protein GY828_02580 [Candidatus Gracilibacteria bacterium]|nr:hypothetical protein [Candidatus Gracilibacteria bacterium]